MRAISQAMLTWLQGDVQTAATCARVTRKDGQVFGFTDHDADIVFQGVTYTSIQGYTASQIESSNSLSTGNAEIDSLFLAGGSVTQADIEAGVWDNAAVLVFLVNYTNLSMGSVNLLGGNLGRFTVLNGGWKVELRSLAQAMQQTIGKQYSATCRAQLGNSQCQVALGPLTFSGTVASVTTPGLAWTDPSLTQVGPTVQFTDTNGHWIPTASPYSVTVMPPSGSFVATTSVTDSAGNAYSAVSGNTNGSSQYVVVVNADGSATYTFDSSNAGGEIFIDFTYAVGYFAFGIVQWTGGQNAGFSNDVRSSSIGTVSLGLPTYYPIQPGDTYTIVAGCDRQRSTCVNRFNNLLNFRGEPDIPGPDVILSPQS
ncbi:DUF2163 domain-containing protein [Burkholderia multivorans]|uniref:DUF2163 domain-containing protein n=1 Tax=Burkholderia multivorans TaxID=87883 RepID=UPI001C2127D3|nr:DUF2163 domain-containing protein [Burkholderia multivorans]MBU9608254.1 DUF2163 domain-containing protein [Burkholderia multivorans]MCA8248070.1 DUF2163 domain-containing protein [Burkholderia multivorans]